MAIEAPPVIMAAEQFNNRLKRQDAAVLQRLVRAYRLSYASLKDKIDLLLTETEGQVLTRGQLVKMSRYKSLMGQIEEELQALQVMTRNEVRGVSVAGVTQGSRDALALMSYAAVGTPQLAAGFNRLPVAQILQALGFLRPDGPLYSRLSQYGAFHAQVVADGIIEGITMGQNPRIIAKQILTDYGGALTDSMRMVRTVQLYSYREANRASYIANSDIVQGWIWYAALDDRTCESCWAMHGTEHSLDETLNDHHAGRCAEIPHIIGFDNPVDKTGEERFNELEEAKQQAILGKEKLSAYQGGAFRFSDLSTTRFDEVYGDMRTATPLWELLGAEPPTRTK